MESYPDVLDLVYQNIVILIVVPQMADVVLSEFELLSNDSES